jgi:hypothetical protein
LMSMSKVPSKYLKCPTCFKTTNYDILQNIISDAMAYRDNRPFNPKDPIIVSKTEIYCSQNAMWLQLLERRKINIEQTQDLGTTRD